MSTPAVATGLVAGVLHMHVAFDWGDEIDLGLVKQLVPSEKQGLPRSARTPASVEYRPLPLHLPLPPTALELPELGSVAPTGELTIFDFGAVSLAWRVPLQLSMDALARLANRLAAVPVVAAARTAIEPTFERLRAAIDQPIWSDLSEEYFVFQFPPEGPLADPVQRAGPLSKWLAELVRLDAGPLSDEEAAEALRLHISYGGPDYFAADWPAAVVIDRDCADTLEVIEFANLQLLEYRHIDVRLDDYLAQAHRVIHGLTQTRLPLWRTHRRSLRELGDLKVEAGDLFERTVNVLKLIGDQYLARVYRLLADRFHLADWGRGIRRKLETLEGTYQTLSDQAAAFRGEFLEVLVIVLIAVEIGLAIWKH